MIISMNLPLTREEHSFIVDAACDYIDEALLATSLLPPAPLVSESTATLLIRKGNRPIGALATATCGPPDDERSEIHSVYLLPKWRGKGYASRVLEEFSRAAPHPPYVREPLPAALAHSASSLKIPTGNPHDTEMLPAVTKSFKRTVPCIHETDPCRACMSTTIRTSVETAFSAFMHQIAGDHLV